jgi:predicted secreted protein
MANEIVGRDVPITIGGNVQGVARTKTLTINNEVINVTADGDDGIQRLLAKPGEKSVEWSVDLMFDSEDEDLIDDALSGTDISTLVSADFGDWTLSGTFMIASLSATLTYNDAITASVALQSSGAVTKAASGGS